MTYNTILNCFLEIDSWESGLKVRKESTEIKIEGLSSLETLQLGIDSLETSFSLKNLSSLKAFQLAFTIINETNTSELFDQLNYIEELVLEGNLYYFNLDSFVNLTDLLISGHIKDGFNFELFKNLSSQLNYLSIDIDCIDYQTIQKFFKGYNFSNLIVLEIKRSDIKRIEKKFLEQFPILKHIHMSECNIETIEDDAFSNSKELIILDLRHNLLKSLYKRYFSNLINLEYFVAYKNPIEFIEDATFSDFKNLKGIELK